MRYRLRTLLIVLVTVCCAVIANYCAYRYACRVTELAFLRLVTNRTVTGEDALTRRRAWDLLLALQADPRIKFVQEPRGLTPLWKWASSRRN
jgi:hypothetical protein